jgi:hypothetical protein
MTTSTATIDNTEIIASIKEAVRKALELIEGNKGDYTRNLSACTLSQEVLAQSEAFKAITELTPGEKVSLATKLFFQLGRAYAQYEANHAVVMEVRGRTLQNPLPATMNALVHETNMRYRQIELTKWVTEELEEAFAA